MPQIVQILGVPFIECLLIGMILGCLGVHVLKREIIFIDIAMAQIAAVGSVAAAVALKAHADGALSYACSIACVLAAAGFYCAVRNAPAGISLEAVIGISYAVAAAAALFLAGIAPGSHVHVHQMLAGSLLWTDWPRIAGGLAVFLPVGAVFIIFRGPLNRLSEDYLGAAADGMRTVWWDFLFYVLLGMVINSAVRAAGVVAVFALLIIPATISALFARGWVGRLLIAWAAAALGSAAGHLFAYRLDFSIGPSVAVFLGAELIIAAAAAGLKLCQPK